MNNINYISGDDKRKMIAELHEEIILWDGYDDALIGVTDDMRAVYDIYKMQKMLYEQFKEDGADLTFEDACEYLEFNVFGAYVGHYTPVHVWILSKD